MAGLNQVDLLKDEKVRAEIDRYKWVESEKAGQDIGFERAAKEWISMHSQAWLAQNSKKKRVSAKKV